MSDQRRCPRFRFGPRVYLKTCLHMTLVEFVTYIHTYMNACINTCTHIHACMHARMHTHASIYVCADIYTHTLHRYGYVWCVYMPYNTDTVDTKARTTPLVRGSSSGWGLRRLRRLGGRTGLLAAREVVVVIAVAVATVGSAKGHRRHRRSPWGLK